MDYAEIKKCLIPITHKGCTTLSHSINIEESGDTILQFIVWKGFKSWPWESSWWSTDMIIVRMTISKPYDEKGVLILKEYVKNLQLTPTVLELFVQRCEGVGCIVDIQTVETTYADYIKLGAGFFNRNVKNTYNVFVKNNIEQN